jgi:hypothetical protein
MALVERTRHGQRCCPCLLGPEGAGRSCVGAGPAHGRGPVMAGCARVDCAFDAEARWREPSAAKRAYGREARRGEADIVAAARTPSSEPRRGRARVRPDPSRELLRCGHHSDARLAANVGFHELIVMPAPVLLPVDSVRYPNYGLLRDRAAGRLVVFSASHRSKSCACVTDRLCVGQRPAEAKPTDTRRRLASKEGACDAVAGADHKAVLLCPDLTVHADDDSVEGELRSGSATASDSARCLFEGCQ